MCTAIPDSQEINWYYWDNFWMSYQLNYVGTDWLPITVQQTDGDDDILCWDGYFLNEARTCVKCPPGCTRCSKPNACLECTHNFEMVNGDGFSYCFLKCLNGQYRITTYNNIDSLLLQFKLKSDKTKATKVPAAILPA